MTAPLVVADDERWAGLAAIGGVEDQQKAARHLAAAFDGAGAVGDYLGHARLAWSTPLDRRLLVTERLDAAGRDVERRFMLKR